MPGDGAFALPLTCDVDENAAMAFEFEIIEIALGETLVGVTEAKLVLARRLAACGQHGEPGKKQNLAIIHGRRPTPPQP
jgi:hypothetical protein